MPNDDYHSPGRGAEYFLRLAVAPQNIGIMTNPSGQGSAVGQCGDSVEVFLQVAGGVITDIKVAPRGCIFTQVCASAMSELVKGKNLDEALYLEPAEIACALGGLPDDHLHCARLAVNTLGEAIDDYYKRSLKRDDGK